MLGLFLYFVFSLAAAAGSAGAMTVCTPEAMGPRGFVGKVYVYQLNSSVGWSRNFFNWRYSLCTRLDGLYDVTTLKFHIAQPSDRTIYNNVYNYRTSTSNYALDLKGFYRAATTGNYTFRISGENGAYINIGSGITCCEGSPERVAGDFSFDNLVHGGPGNNTIMPVKEGSISLTEGVSYPLKIVMFNWSGDTSFNLEVIDPSGNMIPDFGSQVFQATFQKCPPKITPGRKKIFKPRKSRGTRNTPAEAELLTPQVSVFRGPSVESSSGKIEEAVDTISDIPSHNDTGISFDINNEKIKESSNDVPLANNSEASSAVSSEVPSAIITQIPSAINSDTPSVSSIIRYDIISEIPSIVSSVIPSSIITKIPPVIGSKISSSIISEIPSIFSSAIPPVTSSAIPPVTSSAIPPVISSAIPSSIITKIPPFIISSIPSAIISEIPSAFISEISSVISDIPSVVSSDVPPVISSSIASAFVSGLPSVSSFIRSARSVVHSAIISAIPSATTSDVSSVITSDVSSAIISGPSIFTSVISSSITSEVPSTSRVISSADSHVVTLINSSAILSDINSSSSWNNTGEPSRGNHSVVTLDIISDKSLNSIGNIPFDASIVSSSNTPCSISEASTASSISEASSASSISKASTASSISEASSASSISIASSEPDDTSRSFVQLAVIAKSPSLSIPSPSPFPYTPVSANKSQEHDKSNEPSPTRMLVKSGSEIGKTSDLDEFLWITTNSTANSGVGTTSTVVHHNSSVISSSSITSGFVAANFTHSSITNSSVVLKDDEYLSSDAVLSPWDSVVFAEKVRIAVQIQALLSDDGPVVTEADRGASQHKVVSTIIPTITDTLPQTNPLEISDETTFIEPVSGGGSEGYSAIVSTGASYTSGVSSAETGTSLDVLVSPEVTHTNSIEGTNREGTNIIEGGALKCSVISYMVLIPAVLLLV
ncbi:hypothetical protein JCM33374_g3342 [Metschnikowia sp. JCM 33374]|nr:hypothetical protein JCM33374_g3342 [Metschnikowia sp. JCM 33374]